MDPTGPHWSCKEKHVFIFSIAGKPIYSRHGDEDKLASLFGVMQVGTATKQRAFVTMPPHDHSIPLSSMPQLLRWGVYGVNIPDAGVDARCSDASLLGFPPIPSLRA